MKDIQIKNITGEYHVNIYPYPIVANISNLQMQAFNKKGESMPEPGFIDGKINMLL